MYHVCYVIRYENEIKMSERDLESDVFELLNRCAAQNEPIPSMRKIRERLGYGSFTTISSLVKQWREENAEKVDWDPLLELSGTEKLELQNALADSMQTILKARLNTQKQIHDAALKVKDETIQQLRNRITELEKELWEAKQETKRALDWATEKDQKAERAFGEMKYMYQQKEELKAANEKLLQEMQILRSEGDQLMAKNELLSVKPASAGRGIKVRRKHIA